MSKDASSLKLLIYVGIGILGFGMFLFFAMLPAIMSTYTDWIVTTIVGFPLTIGSFLIVLGRM
jgi:hypothetical protein